MEIMVRFECTCFIDMRYVHLKNIDFELGVQQKPISLLLETTKTFVWSVKSK